MRRWLPLCLCLAFPAGCESDQLDAVKAVLDIDRLTLDFGPVPEHTTETRSVTVSNAASVSAEFDISALQGSNEFTLETGPQTIPAFGDYTIDVTFAPMGPGSDQASFEVSWEGLETPHTVTLNGGPIAPCVAVTPNPADFAPATSTTTARPIAIQNGCTSDLHVTSVAIDTDGNQAFTLRPVTPPDAIRPGEEIEVVVDYRRTGDAREGRLLIDSDDPDEPQAIARLLPDPLRACQDGEDNDGDGLTDFPDDPGCTSATDDDESNPPECEDGTMEQCNTDVGECTFGMRTCANRVWGPCEGAVLAQPEECDGLDNDCDMRTDEELTGTCMINGCMGARACIEGGGGDWTDCIPTNPMAETCNGVDDDCDGTIDNGVVRACTVNMCTGTEICVPGGMGEWTNCQITPMQEVCNGMDDDCDGTPDNGIADISCGVGECLRTVAACNMGMPNSCTPGQPSQEVCNGLDDDCNNIADDGLPNLTCGIGECARTAPACANGTNNTCVPGNPGTEVCNGLDDDCDMTPDNNIAPLTCGIGECFRTVPACLNGGNNTCVPGMPGTEVCNGLDDDCNSTPDDNIPPLTCGIGECARTVPACANGGNNTCIPGMPGTEICNGLDDDCDMTPDNNIPNLTCGVGECARSVPACLNGGNNTCVAGPPGTEICNGLDDDCDMTPDNNIPNLTCGVGECARSVPACVNGMDNTCVPGMAVAEICNGLDDDCDGTPDNGVCTGTCGLMSTAADPQEPNNSTTAANPVIAGATGTRTFTYDVTFPVGDEDWFEYTFTPPGSGTLASMTAMVNCVSWAGAGCGATQPTVGLDAWYIDPCFPQLDDTDPGTAALAVVNSAGAISSLGICVPQRFRLRSYPTSPVCAGEAINAEITVTVTFQ